MAEPFLGEIKIFGCMFNPEQWAFCDGQTMAINQNPALYAIIGTIYGGDGVSTMKLPNLKDRAPMHTGSGPGLTPRILGQFGGSNYVTLSTSHLPAHTHAVTLMSYRSATKTPDDTQYMAAGSGGTKIYGTSPASLTPMASEALASSGGNQAHNNLQPSLSMNFCIALAGVFPPRN